jgi:hypothetical protein
MSRKGALRQIGRNFLYSGKNSDFMDNKIFFFKKKLKSDENKQGKIRKILLLERSE